MTRFVKFEHVGAGEPIWIAADHVVSIWADGRHSGSTIRTTADREILVAGSPVEVARLLASAVHGAETTSA